MTLQQLRYVIQVAVSGSMTAAAVRLYVSQPSLSKAISELEQEMGITIFDRVPTGVTITDEGERFLAYARAVVENADRLESHYKGTFGPRPVFAVSSPHNVLVTQAFADVVRAHSREFYQFALREERIPAVFESVRTQHSELGILYRSSVNADHIESAVAAADLALEPIAVVHPVALVATSALPGEQTPTSVGSLAGLPRIDLGFATDEYSGPMGRLLSIRGSGKRVVVGDWETALDLVVRLGGYTIAIGAGGAARRGVTLAHLAELRPVELCVLSRPGIPLSPAARDFSTSLTRLARSE